MKRLLAPMPLAVVACVVALLALLAYGVFAGGEGSEIEEALAQGERPPAPAIELPGLDGEEGSLEDYRGQVVVLNFWASWCDPCREESPLLERFHEDLREQGGTVVGVDVRDVSDDAREFVREYGLSYPQLRDPDEEAMSDYDVRGLPETFVLDRRGRVAAVKRGPVDESYLRRVLDPLLREGP
jgi:cytochrome c biogenesis protein CcmG, thiol:disulfide interchange protein DsbE